MAKIKICGLKRLDDIEIVNKYKPDYIGFVFADSKRKVTSDLACKMKKNLDSSIKSVGVFVDEDIDVIIKLYDEGIIDIAQLHGLENEEYIKKLKQKSNYKLEIMAGGLNSKNISKAIEEFNPYAVDLSSSVETDGYKDELKIKEVMEEVDG